jgi:ribosomal protein S18 acetylase RimI-like enzyme
VTAITLRRMQAADADAVAALHATSWRSAYRGMLTDDFLEQDVVADRQAVWRQRLVDEPTPDGVGIVAEDVAGQLIGFAYVLLHQDPVWGTLIDNLHVHPDHKGGGIGRQLLQAVARELGQTHTQPVFLWVLDANEPAKRFYARMGAEFAEEGLTDGFAGVQLKEWRCVWRDPSVLLHA